MISKKEIECIEMARNIRLAPARAFLADIEKKGIPFVPISILQTLTFLVWDLRKRLILIEKIKKVISIPLILIGAFFIFVFTPVFYVLHLREVHLKKTGLKKKLAILSSDPTQDDVPVEKVLESLWRLQGLEERAHSTKERLDLLCCWVDILYGVNMTKNVRLRYRVAEILNRQTTGYLSVEGLRIDLYHRSNANNPDNRRPDPQHIYLASPVLSLIHDLSEELPLYE